MLAARNIDHGDFSNLAADYAANRPSYNRRIAGTVIGSVHTPLERCKVMDVGAGTGIWSRLLASFRPGRIVAVEPNDEMREFGRTDSDNGQIEWQKGSAEKIEVEETDFDLITMASSFHWPDTQTALAQFHSYLNHEGRFCAVWNPRLTERSTIEVEIQKLLENRFDLKTRRSSGRSGITEHLYDLLNDHELFRDCIYMDAIDKVMVEKERYIGAWRSVNDVRHQLGEEDFTKFIDTISGMLANVTEVDVFYQTRAWLAVKR